MPVWLFFKAKLPGSTHTEYRVRKDGVTQRYHVGVAPAISGTAPTPSEVLVKRDRLLGRAPTPVDRADVPVQLLTDYLAGSAGARGRAATWAVGILPRTVSTMDLGVVGVTRSGIKDALYHGSGPLKLLAIPHLVDLLAQAVLLRQRPKGQGRSFLVASTLRYQGEVFVARMVVEEDRNGRRFYNHEFTEIKKLEGYSNSGAPVTDYGKLAGDPQASDESIVQALLSVKPDAVLNKALAPTAANASPDQLAAGNYRKRHVRFQGLDVSIENPKGTVRSGTDPDGKPWRTRMRHAYGYILGSRGVDKDHVDCYLGPDKDASHAYVVHQRKAGDWKRFDEDKVMLGFPSETEARQAFLVHYDDPRFLGPIDALPMEEFRRKVLATADHPRLIKHAGAPSPLWLFFKARPCPS